MIELTPEQQQILDASNGSPPIVIDPRTAKTYVLVPKAPEPVDFEIPEGIRRSRAALRRDLPELLARCRNRGKLVCYAQEERVGISHDYAGLILECVRRNIPSNEFIVEVIRPGAGNEEEIEFEPRY